MILELGHQNPILTGFFSGFKPHYFCPLPGCKYHIFNNNNNTSHSSLPTLKQLKQHYTKVHSSKSHACQGCSSKFPTPHMLSRHAKVCGRKFKCGDCPGEYGSLETLQTHCRRKGHALAKEILDNRRRSAQNKQREELEIRVSAHVLDGKS